MHRSAGAFLVSMPDITDNFLCSAQNLSEICIAESINKFNLWAYSTYEAVYLEW
ncbi:MAG: hypothetical protein PHT92_10825 [Bacteroidales bacterium]|nr:hypothetical protein [Bacteroidales bacterium]MDY0254170.1 hypothetical protein [Tenuifilaceae bacterium]